MKTTVITGIVAQHSENLNVCIFAEELASRPGATEGWSNVRRIAVALPDGTIICPKQTGFGDIWVAIFPDGTEHQAREYFVPDVRMMTALRRD